MKKTIQPDQWPEGSPERALAEFLLCWQKLDFEKAVEYTQRSWCKAMKESAGVLAQSFAHKALERVFYIDRTEAPGLNADVILEMKVLVSYRMGRKDTKRRIHKKIISARVIREDEDGAPDPAGAWGVNPVSALRES